MAYHPFDGYLIRRYCPQLEKLVEGEHCRQEYLVAPRLYNPPVLLREGPERLIAEIVPEHRYRLYDQEDFRSWRGPIVPSVVKDNFRGRIGERLLALVLRGFLHQMLQQAQQSGYTQTRGGILQEKRKREGKPFHRHIVHWNERYLLKFDRRTTLVILQKAEQGRELHYVQELSIQKTEIDGLAALYLKRPGESAQKYLLIAEVNTTEHSSLYPNSFRSRKEGIEDRLFLPLRSLFPDYQLIYALMGHPRALFSGGHPYPALNPTTTRIARFLDQQGIYPILLPIPASVNCAELAAQCYGKIREFRERVMGI